jgi:ArsR family transcriptional regulator, arsenate/arsenite/antimonite-responsive transcriptional repressor
MKQLRENTVEGFKAIGDGTRFRILKILSEYKKLCVNAIAEKLNISQPVASQHLKILKHSDLVNAEKMGNHIHYSIKMESIDYLQKELNELIKSSDYSCRKDKCRNN